MRPLKTTVQLVCCVLSINRLANWGTETLGSLVQARRSDLAKERIVVSIFSCGDSTDCQQEKNNTYSRDASSWVLKSPLWLPCRLYELNLGPPMHI